MECFNRSYAGQHGLSISPLERRNSYLCSFSCCSRTRLLFCQRCFVQWQICSTGSSGSKPNVSRYVSTSFPWVRWKCVADSFSARSGREYDTRKFEYASSTARLWHYWWWSNDIRWVLSFKGSYFFFIPPFSHIPRFPSVRRIHHQLSAIGQEIAENNFISHPSLTKKHEFSLCPSVCSATSLYSLAVFSLFEVFSFIFVMLTQKISKYKIVETNLAWE